jgi:1-acyl-sn-glycerol-3-phosphate acyltransferase
MYRAAMAVSRPVVRTWGRLEVDGLDVLPASGPVLVVANHDSHWDPIAVGVAAIRRRQIKALAKSTLWDVRGLAPVLNGMGQIPIERGAGDAGALARAIEELRAGACIGVFPEGTRSRGEVLRARSGVGRLALEVPEARLVCVTIEGTSDLTGFPKRPRLRVRFFDPRAGAARRGARRDRPAAPRGDSRAGLALDLLPQAQLALRRARGADWRDEGPVADPDADRSGAREVQRGAEDRIGVVAPAVAE